MIREELLQKARARAIEILDENISLSNEYFATLSDGTEDEAIAALVEEWLENAADQAVEA
jgi:hypothetical protein